MDTVKYNLGDIVYKKVKTEKAYMVTGILFRSSGHFYYIKDGDGEESIAFEMELTKEKSYDLNKFD